MEPIMTLKVIGAGLGRTGTASLKVALEQLLGGRCYHMSECFGNPANPPLWLAAAQGRADWDAIFKGYVATVDYPACGFWRELAARYPQAKVLLTVRDPDNWFESTRETILSEGIREIAALTPDKAFFDETVFRDYVGHFGDRPFITDYFRRHNEAVTAAIFKDRLLVYEVGQGWEPLCEFLGLPVPDAPFPHVNTRADFEAMMAGMRQMLTAGPGGLDQARQHLTDIHHGPPPS
jgi:hypothetical protein